MVAGMIVVRMIDCNHSIGIAFGWRGKRYGFKFMNPLSLYYRLKYWMKSK